MQQILHLVILQTIIIIVKYIKRLILKRRTERASARNIIFSPISFHFRLKNNKLKYNKEDTMLVLSALYLCPGLISRAMCH